MKKDRQFWESAKMNNDSYMQYFNMLAELSMSMFEWSNLPKSIDSRFLELALFTDGMSVFFYDEDMEDYLALRTMIGGTLNVYQIPEQRTAYASNGYNKMLDSSNSVLIFNNFMHNNSLLNVEIYAKRLYNLDRAIEVNANAQKTPVLIQCDETQRLVMSNLYKKYEGNEPYIFGDKSLNTEGIKVLRTDAPYVADKLYALKSQIWNEALTYLGISNVNFQKKERLLSDEVTRGLGGTVASRYSRLETRRKACKEINNMFGLNISCNFRKDFEILESNTQNISQS